MNEEIKNLLVYGEGLSEEELCLEDEVDMEGRSFYLIEAEDSYYIVRQGDNETIVWRSKPKRLYDLIEEAWNEIKNMERECEDCGSSIESGYDPDINLCQDCQEEE